MATSDKEIYIYEDTVAGLLANLKNKQRGVMTDSPANYFNHNWMWKHASKVYLPAVSMVHDGVSWAAADVLFGKMRSTTLADEFITGGIALSESGNSSLDSAFTASSLVGAINELKLESFTATSQTGWPAVRGATFAFDDASRTLTVTDNGSDYYKIKGENNFLNGDHSVIITDTDGGWFIYFNSSGVLTASQTAWSIPDNDKAFVSYLYWDSTAARSILTTYEMHDFLMSSSTHYNLHETSGTRWSDGLAASSAGSDNINMTNGQAFDEDIPIDVFNGTGSTLFEQILQPAQLPIYYRNSTAGWKIFNTSEKLRLTDLGYVDGTPTLKYNYKLGESWSLASVSAGKFIAMYCVLTTDIHHPIALIMGQAEYNTVALARESAYATLDLTGMPFQEITPLHRIIIKQKSTANYYSLQEILDIRNTQQNGVVNPSISDHGALIGLSDDDHSIYALLAGRSGGQTLYGGTDSGDDITIEGTSNATKGYVLLNPNGGNVGIGTSVPLLDVGSASGDFYNAGVTGGMHLKNSTDTNGAMYLILEGQGASANGESAGFGGGRIVFAGSLGSSDNKLGELLGGGNAFVFRSLNDDTSVQRELIRFEYSSGYVGIGRNSPTVALDVNGYAKLSTGTSINEFSVDGTMAGNSDDAVPTEKAIVTYVSGIVGGASLWSRNSGSGYLYPTTLTDKVGIGTSTPTQALDVVGSAKASVSVLTPLVKATSSAGLSLYEDGGLGIKIADATANVGINQNTPGAKLDILSAANSEPVLKVTGTGTGKLASFWDNTVEVFTILDGGKVGIGIATPTSKVDIDAGADSEIFRCGRSLTQPYYLRLTANNFGLGIWTGSTKGSETQIITISDVNFGILNTLPTHPLDIGVNANIGIKVARNVTGPELLLDYEPTGAGVTGEGPSIFFNGKSTTAVSRSMGEIGYRWTDATQVTRKSEFFISTCAAGAASTQKVVVTGDGKVGIGTTTPLYALQIASTGSALLFEDTDGVSGQKMYAIRTGADNLQFSSRNDDGSFQTALMTMKNDGTIGIGTSSPTQTLDVVGNAKASVSVLTPLVKAISSAGLSLHEDGGKGITIQDSTGYVGINDTVPIVELDVTGTAQVTTKVFTPMIKANSVAGLSLVNAYDQGIFIEAEVCRVGINQTSPVAMLDINQSNATYPTLKLTQSSTGDIVSAFSSSTEVFTIEDDGKIFSQGMASIADPESDANYSLVYRHITTGELRYAVYS